jgi:acyl-CoA dehydrogenase
MLTTGVDLDLLRTAVRDLCSGFSNEYWRENDQKQAYPKAFVDALTDAGYLAALIPEEYGGSGLGIMEASVILEEINRSGGNSGPCHAQMYIMGSLLRHGSEEQKRRFLPKIANGELRLQSFAVTETYHWDRHYEAENNRRPPRRSICDQRSKGLHFQGLAG